MKKKCKVELVGGLGNQLFGVAFGRYIEHKFGFEVEFLRSESISKNNNHGENLRHMSLFGQPVHSKSLTFFQRTRLFLSQCGLGALVNSAHESDFVFENFHPKAGMVVRGYFQTPEPFNYLSSIGAGVIERTSGASQQAWKVSKADSPGKHACIHMRFGDYKTKPGYGPLPFEYFEQACERVFRLHARVEAFYIFSDSPEDAEHFRLRLSARFPRVEFVLSEPGKDSKPIEDLLAMSQFDVIIMANSTFSYWSAILGPTDKTVLYPNPWFMDPKILVPTIPSSWQECSFTHRSGSIA